MRNRKSSARLLSILLVLSLLFGTQFGALAAEGDTTAAPVGAPDMESALALSANHPGGLIDFNGDYALVGDGRMVTVIVEFVHQPAELEKAIASQSRSRAIFNEGAARAAAEQDQQSFRSALDAFSTAPMTLGGGASSGAPAFEVVETYSLGINGVAVTLPDTYVERLLDLDFVYAVYPNGKTQVDFSSEMGDEDAESEMDFSSYSAGGAAGLAAGAVTNPIGMYNSRVLFNLDALHATGVNGTPATGEGITVAVVDTGVDYNHPDLKNAFGAFTDHLPNGQPTKPEELLNGKFYGRNYINTDNDFGSNNPMDDHGHGTHCAGTIAGRGENEPYSVLGVAPKVNLLAYKVLDSDSSCIDNTTEIAGFEGAVKDGCDVISLSLGSWDERGPCAAITLFLNNLTIEFPNVVFVFCAGNKQSASGLTLWTPSTSAAVITVANAIIPVANKAMVIKRADGTQATLQLINNSWALTPQWEAGNSAYTLRDTADVGSNRQTLIQNENGTYDAVYLPSKEDPSAASMGLQADFDAYIADHGPDSLKGKLLILGGGNASTINKLAKTINFGGIIIPSTSTPASLPGKDNIPVFAADTGANAALTAGLTPSATVQLSVQDIYTLGRSPSINSGSCRGPVTTTYEIKPDIACPGTNVLSAKPDFYGTGVYTYAYQNMTGTSMATPHVAGMVALLRQQDPKMSVAEIRARLSNTAETLGDSVFVEGTGMANPTKALTVDCYATATNSNMLTRSKENQFVPHNVETTSLSFGVVPQGSAKTITIPVTVHNMSADVQNFTVGLESRDPLPTGISFDPSCTSISVPAKSQRTFSVTASVANSAPVCTAEGILTLTGGNMPLRLPYAVSTQTYDDNLPLLAPEASFLQTPVVSNGDKQQITNIENYNSSDSIFQYRFNSDYPVYRSTITDAEGTQIGVAMQYWSTILKQDVPFSYSGLITGNYYPCEFSADGTPLLPRFNTVPAVKLPEGHYKLAITGFGSKILTDKTTFFDFYVDNTLPTLSMDNYAGKTWNYTISGENAVLTGNIFDAGTAEMAKLNINDSVNQRLNGVGTSQKDNVVVLQVGADSYRADVQEDGKFTVTVPVSALTGPAKLYYGDHFLPVGNTGGFGKTAATGFNPNGLSYSSSGANSKVPLMKNFAYRAANLDSMDITLEQYLGGDGSGSSGTSTSPAPELPKPDVGGNTAVAVPVKPTTKGDTASATVPEKAVTDAIESAVKEAAKTGGTSSVEIQVAAPKGAKTVETTLTSKSLAAVSDGKTESLKIATPVAEVSFDSEALKNIAGVAGKDVTISIAQVDKGGLTDTQKQQVGDAPVFDFTITSDGRTISDFNGGTATVSVPYTLKAGENPEFVTVWLLDDAGKLIPINAKYADGKITFETGHFSRYAIGYLPFTDVNADWAYESIVYAYNNQLFSGVGNDSFAPADNMSRAMLWSVLYRMAGAPAKTDAPALWYTDAQKWAIAEGISDGSNPMGNVTREQLATILYRYAKATAASADMSGFTDTAAISGFAKDATSWAVATGILNGSAGKLNPQGNATRAEVAVVMERFMQSALA